MAVGKLFEAIFYTVSNGRIVRQFQNKTSSSIERTNKNGRVVHEEIYDYLEGTIIDIVIKEHDEYGKFWSVTLKDNEDTIQNLQFNYSSGYAAGFLKALPNIDIKKSIKIIPNAKKINEKIKTTIFITQNDKAAKWYFTKENPNGLPPLQKIKIKGKEAWDDTDAMEFLEKMINERMLPHPKNEKGINIISAALDDLPF